MGRGTLRGVLTAWLTLIALEAAVSSDVAPKRIREAFNDLDALVRRIRDPKRAAIPDLRTGETWGGPSAPLGTFGEVGDRDTGRPAGPFVPPGR